MLLAMAVVVLEVVALGFQGIVVFIFDFPPATSGGNDLRHVAVISWGVYVETPGLTFIDAPMQGRNPGDVLDPYILAASQQLVYGGDLEGTFTATVAHKILMIVEALLGHLHEDVVGAMRGNVRAPEPCGADQETLDPRTNPFPGADIVQPPLGKRRPLRFHQVKSKTGSAKGGDGRRLGLQLLELQRLYGGEIYYDALIGNTLRGHRSMAGVLRAAPNVVVLVGESAFLALTGTAIGPELLLRLYQAAFDVAAQKSGYRIQDVVEAVYGTSLSLTLSPLPGGEGTERLRKSLGAFQGIAFRHIYESTHILA